MKVPILQGCVIRESGVHVLDYQQISEIRRRVTDYRDFGRKRPLAWGSFSGHGVSPPRRLYGDLRASYDDRRLELPAPSRTNKLRTFPDKPRVHRRT